MKKIKKSKVYLDYNIYDRLGKGFLKDDILRKNNIKIYLSVGHAEEYYKALKNDKDNKNKEILDNIYNEMISLTPSGVLNPSKTRIINKNEKFEKCIKRVKENDTNNIVDKHGTDLNKIQKDSVESYMKDNRNVMNYSNLSCDEIWNQKEIIDRLNKFTEYVQRYKEDTFMQIANLYGYSVAREICNMNYDGFKIKKNCYRELENNYALLECVIEFLHNLLSGCGYNRDKKTRTSISGIYDVQHSIYATYCDYFISEDATFSKRVMAVYNFLGVKTQIINFDKFESMVGQGLIIES